MLKNKRRVKRLIFDLVVLAGGCLDCDPVCSTDSVGHITYNQRSRKK